MSLYNQAKKGLKFIEGKRHSKNPLFFSLVLIKDIGWIISYWFPNKLADIYGLIKNYLFFLTYNLSKSFKKPAKEYFKISFCITCMDRLPHLKKTLKKNLKNNANYPNVEFVLLDYNSKDGLQEWVLENFKNELKNGRLAYYQTKEPEYFHMAKAKNIAHQLATGDIVCNLDADNYTGKDFAFFINSSMQSTTEIIGAYQKSQINDPSFYKSSGGRIFLTKKNFLKLGGYDENFIGWGYEDDDFKIRANALGLKKAFIHPFFLSYLPHNNQLREKNMEITMEESNKKNKELLECLRNSGRTYVKNEIIDFTKIKRIK